MSNCNQCGSFSCGCGVPQINQGSSEGENKILSITLKDRCTGDPIDLTDCSAIVANFPAADGTVIEKTLGDGILVITPDIMGKIQIELTGTDTNALTPGRISFLVYVTISGSVSIAQFMNALMVNPPPFPGA